jgi:hypothetical protein
LKNVHWIQQFNNSSFHKFPLMKKEGLYNSSFGHVMQWDKMHMSTCVLQNLTAGVGWSRSELLKNQFVEQHPFCACLLGSYIKHPTFISGLGAHWMCSWADWLLLLHELKM